MTARADPIDVLDRRSALALLGAGGVARLALSIGALPTVVPVRYLVEDADLLVAVRADEAVRRAVVGAVVAFEADRLGPSGPCWSVVVRGWAEAVPPPVLDAVCARLFPGSTPASVEVVRLHTQVVEGSRWCLEEEPRRP